MVVDISFLFAWGRDGSKTKYQKPDADGEEDLLFPPALLSERVFDRTASYGGTRPIGDIANFWMVSKQEVSKSP